MKRFLLIGALAALACIGAADAKPKHHRKPDHSAQPRVSGATEGAQAADLGQVKRHTADQPPAGERGAGSDGGTVQQGVKQQGAARFFVPSEILTSRGPGHNWNVEWKIEKWANTRDFELHRTPNATAFAHGNLLCTAGITRMLNLLTGNGGQALDATHCRLGAGDSTTAATAGDTDLGAAAGSTHRWFQLVTGIPTVSTNVGTFVAAFGTSDGNFAWQEFGTDAGTASGNTVVAPLLNHKISSLGTKASGTWTLTETVTISDLPPVWLLAFLFRRRRRPALA